MMISILKLAGYDVGITGENDFDFALVDRIFFFHVKLVSVYLHVDLKCSVCSKQMPQNLSVGWHTCKQILRLWWDGIGEAVYFKALSKE